MNLTCFKRNNSCVDFGEKIGDYGFSLFRVGFGHTFRVEKDGFQKKPYSLYARITAIALIILALPLSALGAALGAIGYKLSLTRPVIQRGFIIDTAQISCQLAQGRGAIGRNRREIREFIEGREVLPEDIAACLQAEIYFEQGFSLKKELENYQTTGQFLPNSLRSARRRLSFSGY